MDVPEESWMGKEGEFGKEWVCPEQAGVKSGSISSAVMNCRHHAKLLMVALDIVNVAWCSSWCVVSQNIHAITALLQQALHNT